MSPICSLENHSLLQRQMACQNVSTIKKKLIILINFPEPQKQWSAPEHIFITGSGILARKSNVIGSVWIAIRKKCVHDRFGRKSKKHVIGSDFSKLIGRADYVLGFPTPA